jgi:hypothetical protein
LTLSSMWGCCLSLFYAWIERPASELWTHDDARVCLSLTRLQLLLARRGTVVSRAALSGRVRRRGGGEVALVAPPT